MAEVQRGHDKSIFGQGLIEPLGAGQVAAIPGAAMEVDHRWKRPVALRFIKPGNQRLVAVPEIFDIFRCEFVGRHHHSLVGVVVLRGATLLALAQGD